MKNIYIVSSPFQCISAIEAKTQFNLKDNLLIAIYHLKDSDTIVTQMRETFGVSQWDEVIEIGINKTKSKYFEYLDVIKKVNTTNYDNLFVGNFGQFPMILMSNLSVNKIYAIDDGMGTIQLHKNELNPFKEQKKGFLKSIKLLRYSLLNLKTSFDKKRLNYFTMFDLKPNHTEEIILNKFGFMKGYSSSKIIDTNIVYFIGQAIAEDGWISKNAYIKLLKKIKNYYSSLGLKIIYIPHRRETQLDIINTFIDDTFKIEKHTLAIELHLLKIKVLPIEISSFMSTALYSIQKIFPIQTKAFFIAKQDLNISHKMIEKRYNELKDNGSTIIEVESI